jgi:hypothetical protein
MLREPEFNRYNEACAFTFPAIKNVSEQKHLQKCATIHLNANVA